MDFCTDLAVEMREASGGNDDGLLVNEYEKNGIKVSHIEIINAVGEQKMQRPCGKYITVETDAIMSGAYMEDGCIEVLQQELAKLLPNAKSVLVCGIGNHNITPDALGPKVASLILATRHLSPELAKSVGLGDLCPVSVVSPGVMGQTGMEIGEILGGLVEKIMPDCVIVIDALAARELDRLGKTVQLSDTGIIPGSGVHNARNELSRKTLNVPVISIGVPTVVNAKTLANDICKSETAAISDSAEQMIVTPREIDTIIDHAANIVAMGINCALQPHISLEDMAMLVG